MLRDIIDVKVRKKKENNVFSSLIQRDLGEHHLNHGFLIWNFKVKKDNFPYRTLFKNWKRIYNKNEFVKIEINRKGHYQETTPTSPNYLMR